MKKTTQTAVCAVITALSVVLLFLGGIASVFAYAMPMVVGLLNIILSTTFSKKSALVAYVATSVLALFLVSDKECALMYALFFGYYPIIENSISKLGSAVLRMFLKLVIFNLAVILIQIILVYVFGIPFLEEGESKYFAIIFIILMNFVFIIYDKMLKNIVRLYQIRLEKYIKKIFK